MTGIRTLSRWMITLSPKKRLGRIIEARRELAAKQSVPINMCESHSRWPTRHQDDSFREKRYMVDYAIANSIHPNVIPLVRSRMPLLYSICSKSIW